MVPYLQRDIGISVPAYDVFHDTDIFVAPSKQSRIIELVRCQGSDPTIIVT
jgi:hypothetical protein